VRPQPDPSAGFHLATRTPGVLWVSWRARLAPICPPASLPRRRTGRSASTGDEGDRCRPDMWSREPNALLVVLSVVLTSSAVGGMVLPFADTAVWTLFSWVGMVVAAFCVARSLPRSTSGIAAWTVLMVAAVPTPLPAAAFALIGVTRDPPWWQRARGAGPSRRGADATTGDDPTVGTHRNRGDCRWRSPLEGRLAARVGGAPGGWFRASAAVRDGSGRSNGPISAQVRAAAVPGS